MSWCGRGTSRPKKISSDRGIKSFTIEDRDACCEAQSDSRLGTNTDFLDGLSFGKMSYLGWCLYQVASYYVASRLLSTIREGIPNSIPYSYSDSNHCIFRDMLFVVG